MIEDWKHWKPSKCALKQFYKINKNQTLRKPFIAMVIVIRSDSPWYLTPQKNLEILTTVTAYFDFFVSSG